jgi:hypothetical protein
MHIPSLIGAIVMFVFCFLIKKFLHRWGLPLIMIVGLAGFILLMIGLFKKSKFTNVQTPVKVIEPEESEQQEKKEV